MSNRIEDLIFSKDYDWKLFPQVEEFLSQHVLKFLNHNVFAQYLSKRMAQESATLFVDWIDHMILPETKIPQVQLEQLGYQEVHNIELPTGSQLFYPSGTIFFPLILSRKSETEIVLKPERIDHFIQMIGKQIQIDGEILSPYRKAIISSDDGYILSAVERRGYNGYIVPNEVNDADSYQKALEKFTCRTRQYSTEVEGLTETLKLLKGLLNTLSKPRITDAFFRAERLYWERQNRAGQIQIAQQNRLGLGWGNHDHHTYRSSRVNFVPLIQIFEQLGFMLREQFFAGENAGWGAQLLEHPSNNIVLFCDVDISKNEQNLDFAHQKMEPRDTLKTVGLWVAIHGESILGGGLHHLAACVDFDKSYENLQTLGSGVLNPFSSFEFLKQAFTEIERRIVTKNRLKELLSENQIKNEQFNTFIQSGAISSHFELIQRNQGFKGFNQDSVTAIIKYTDPRTTNITGN